MNINHSGIVSIVVPIIPNIIHMLSVNPSPSLIRINAYSAAINGPVVNSIVPYIAKGIIAIAVKAIAFEQKLNNDLIMIKHIMFRSYDRKSKLIPHLNFPNV